MDSREREALDRHITGNYGEDQLDQVKGLQEMEVSEALETGPLVIPPLMPLSQPHSASVTISTLQRINIQRCERWHGQKQWTILEWAGAMCGEAGEAANVAKKIRRAQMSLPGNSPILKLEGSARFLQYLLADEIADTIIYASLLASYGNIDLADAIVSKFNKKSIEQGFSERL